MQEEPEPTLAEIEEEVLAEGREWTRQRLQQMQVSVPTFDTF